MMKNRLFIFPALIAIVAISSCGRSKTDTGRVYMPDMAYSRAYETYSDHSNLADSGVFYNNMPVPGTVSRTQDYVYHIQKDKAGEEIQYNASSAVSNPVTYLSNDEMLETERLYLINCGICHGSKLDGNGPLYKGGDGPFPAKPATLIGDAKYEAMTAGQMFYSVTYGRNLMGSYASQLTPKQRWDIIYYIKSKQSGGKTGAMPAADSTNAGTSTPAPADSTTKM